MYNKPNEALYPGTNSAIAGKASSEARSGTGSELGESRIAESAQTAKRRPRMRPKEAAGILAWICCGLLVIAVAALAPGQTTLLTPSQLANAPSLPGQFGFSCTSVGPSTVCQVDQTTVLNLALPCPAGGLPCPSPFSPGIAPKPGACPSTGSVIVTNEPAAYFCVLTFPGAPNLNWIRVAGVNSW
jgi:hypothetical protein